MAARVKQKKNSEQKVQSLTSLTTSEPTAVDIIAYAYFFVGLHKGPYYRWRVFDDHFHTPFGVLGDCRIITEQKFKKALVCGIVYALLNMKYTPERYSEDEFYTTHSTDYRYLYNVPLLIMYFLMNHTIMNLSYCVCSETGFGVYPAKSMPMPGRGPMTGQSLLKLASTSTEVALEQEYNFGVLESYESDRLILGPKMHDTMRAWEMTTRYWYWEYMYRNFIRANKEVRSAFSFLAWTIWCGPSMRQAIISCTMWVYLHLEREYVQLFDTSGSLQKPWDIGFSIMRMFCLIYLTPCFVVMNTDALLKYYNSIYWAFHGVLLALMVLAIIGYKLKGPVDT